MTRIDITFVDTLGFQNELNEKFGKGVFTVCVDRTDFVKSKYVVYDETITENSEIQTVIPGCGGHDIIEITKFVCVTPTIINEVIAMAQLHNKLLLESDAPRLNNLIESKSQKLINQVLTDENVFNETFDDLTEWLKDKSQPYPLSLQIYSKQNSISCEESVVLLQTENDRRQTYINAIKNIKLQGKLELLDIQEYLQFKLKVTQIIDSMINLQY